MKQQEYKRLIILLDKFEKEHRLKELSLWESADINEATKIVKRVQKQKKR